MARARELPGLAEAPSFGAAAAMAVEVRAGEVFSFEERALDTGDIEGVHDMRVATRRLRAVMELFAPCFPERPYRKALRDVKRLADALGARRDPDVAIAALERIAARLGDADRPGVESMIAELRARQTAANEALEAAIARAHERGLPARLSALAAEADRA